jgi:hypothetical protein
MGGACVPASDREAACGAASTPAEGGCLPKPCPTGVIDGVSGVCLPVGSVRALADSLQVTLLPDETLECSGSSKLVVGGTSSACVAAEAACGPGSIFTAGSAATNKCAPIRACAPGEVALGDGCERIVHPGENSPIVDVALWARAMLGADGGLASSFVCGGFQTAPWTFTAATDVRFTIAVSIDLQIPDNDVTQARARIGASEASTGQPVDASTVQRVVDRLISGLRAIGGTSRAAAISTQVRCVLPVAGRPMAVPMPPHPSP